MGFFSKTITKMNKVGGLTGTQALKFLKNLSLLIGGKLPGLWTSNHIEESQQYDGWVYVAIRAIMHQYSGATPVVSKYAENNSVSKSANDTLSGGDVLDLRPVGRSHPVQRLLLRPNPTQSGRKFQSLIAQQLKLTGSAYVYNIYSVDRKEIYERYIIPTAILRPQPFSDEFPQGAYRIIPIATQFGYMGDYSSDFVQRLILTGQLLDARDFQFHREPHPFVFGEGFSPLSAAAKWSDTADAVDESRYSHIQQGPRPGLIISETDDMVATTQDRETVQQDIKDRHSDPTAHGQSLYLPHGLKADPWPQPATSLGYDGTFTQMRDSILAIFGVPPIGAGITEAGSYTAYYAAVISWIEQRIEPDLDDLGDADSLFFSAVYGEDLIVQYRAKKPNDPQLLDQRVNTLGSLGAITYNEARVMQGLPPTKEVWGDMQMVGNKRESIKEDVSGTGASAELGLSK